MAPIRRRGPRGGLVSTRLPLNAVNSVATQAANKRQPNEADQIDNALVSLERGLEKRPGFEIVPQYTIQSFTSESGWSWGSNASRLDLFSLPTGHDLFYYWYSINEDNTFLVVIDYDATGATDKLFYVFKLLTDGTWRDYTPATQWDTSISVSNSVVVAYATANSITAAAAAALGCVNADTRAYITYGTGTKTAKESLRVVSLGSNLVVLNTNVSAGFSSDYTNNTSTDGKLFDLGGTITATNDIEGRRVTYYSAAKVMKVYDTGDDAIASTADDVFLGWKPGIISGTVTTPTSTTTATLVGTVFPDAASLVGAAITLTSSTGVVQTSTVTTYNAITKLITFSPAVTTAPAAASAYKLTLTTAAYIPASDYFYYDSDKAYLGQRVDDISEIRLPPENDDWYAVNNNVTSGDNAAQLMLASLYDGDTKVSAAINGRGKVYYTLNPYLNLTAGYYRVVSWSATGPTYYYDSAKTIYTSAGAGRTAITSTGRPYLQKIRTPDEHSYLDPRRMPQKISVTLSAGSVTNWSAEKIKWTPRTSGDKSSNPGPSVFKTADGSALKHTQIKAMAVFHNRLWFAANDVVFSSQVGAYENLFITDPSNIVSSDPIDIRASSNQYAEISSMVPFDDYLFIDTKAKTQFQLMGNSSSELSPTNVSVSPVTFYSTAAITTPQLIGTRLYFFGPQRMYLYVGKNQMGYASAVETSSSAANYLPVNYRSICTAPAQDTVAMVSEENPNEIYFNTSRFSADRIIQNSFYRYLLDDTHEIQSVQSFNNYLYAVVKIDTTANGGSGIVYTLMRTKLILEDSNVPRMDDMIKIKLLEGNNVSYNAATNLTTFTVPPMGYTANNTRFVLASPWTVSSEDISGTVLMDITATGSSYLATSQSFTVSGNYATDGNYLYVGNIFETRIQLSTLFVRDENNNIIDGVLNIRSGVFRHFNTGNYDIEVAHRGRSPLVSTFNAQKVDFTSGEDTLSLETTENQGEFVAKIFGYSDSTKIAIVSDYTTPMNITNMEFKGKFKQKYTTLN